MEIRPHRIIKRKKTKEIKVGKISVGGASQISVQSMTNTITTDVKKTIADGFSVLSELFINIEDMIKRNSYISASRGLFSDRTYNLLRKL